MNPVNKIFNRVMGSVRRVVVTGLGLVTPLGVGAPQNWLLLTAGKVATAALTDPRYSQVCTVTIYFTVVI